MLNRRSFIAFITALAVAPMVKAKPALRRFGGFRHLTLPPEPQGPVNLFAIRRVKSADWPMPEFCEYGQPWTWPVPGETRTREEWTRDMKERRDYWRGRREEWLRKMRARSAR